MLTLLQEKLAEAHGLAIAASVVAAKLQDRIEPARLASDLGLMQLEADETRARCLAAEQRFGAELAAEMLAHANSTSMTGADLLAAWFDTGTDSLAAWTFVAMGEAGEVAAWRVVRVLADDAVPAVRALAEWALPVQERHLRIALDDVAALAGTADPTARGRVDARIRAGLALIVELAAAGVPPCPISRSRRRSGYPSAGGLVPDR